MPRLRPAGVCAIVLALAALSITGRAAAQTATPYSLAAFLGHGTTDWACHLEAEGGVPDRVTLNQTETASHSPVHQLARLRINGSKVTGTIYHEAVRSCTISNVTGQLTLDAASETGMLTLTLPLGAQLVEPPADVQCSVLFGGQTTFKETFHVVVAAAKDEIYLAGVEHFFPAGDAATNGALVPVTGTCIRQ